LYVIAKTYTEIEKTYSYATRQATMTTLEMITLPEGSGLGSDEGGCYLKSGGLHPPRGSV